MKTAHDPRLRAPVEALRACLAAGARAIPLADLAALFGAEGELLERARARGDLVLRDGRFSNDGPPFVAPAGRAEIEIPDLLRGAVEVTAGGFVLAFPHEDFAPRACAQIAFLRKCFPLRAIRVTEGAMTLDFGGGAADRVVTF